MTLRGEIPLEELPEERVSAYILPGAPLRNRVLVREALQPARPRVARVAHSAHTSVAVCAVGLWERFAIAGVVRA